MTHEEIIMQLSNVIAEQQKKIKDLESMKAYLKDLNDKNVEQINKLNKEIEKLGNK